jgi:hypothetical protein
MDKKLHKSIKDLEKRQSLSLAYLNKKHSIKQKKIINQDLTSAMRDSEVYKYNPHDLIEESVGDEENQEDSIRFPK